MTLRQLAGTVLAVLAACGSASAQGNGHGNAYGHYKSTVSSASSSASTPGTSAAAIPGTGVRNFGSWLDDASILDRGDGFVSFGFGVFKTPIYREIDFPSVDSGFALTDRVQLGMTLPYYHANALGAPMSRGFGDVYLNAKVQLRAPTAGRLGVGLIPMVEVLSVAPPSGGGRMQWALPVSVERQWSGWRLMGTSGYFSREPPQATLSPRSSTNSALVFEAFCTTRSRVRTGPLPGGK